MPLAPGLATWLVEQGHDAVHARQLGLDRAPDTEILERARIDNRVVVTADLDYPRLLACARAEGPGLILFRGGEYSESETVEHLSAALAVNTGRGFGALHRRDRKKTHAPQASSDRARVASNEK